MRIATFFLFLGLFLQVQAQMKQPDPTVFIFVGDSIFPMNVITSQTELKKGWDIQGINVGRKIKRYFSGAQARQTTGFERLRFDSTERKTRLPLFAGL